MTIDAGATATLTWNASTGGTNNPLVGYRIFVEADDGDQIIGDTTATTYSVPASQKAGETMRLYVRAVGEWSMSQPSSVVELTSNLPPVPPRSNEAITQFLFFNAMDELQFVRDDAISLHTIEEEMTCTGSFPYDPEKPINVGMRIGWLEGDELRIYDIRQPETDLVEMTQSFEAEHAAIA